MPGPRQPVATLLGYPQQHLELVAVGRQTAPLDHRRRFPQQVVVVGGDTDIGAAIEQSLEGRKEVPAHLAVVLDRHAWRFDIDALAQAHVGALRQRRDVGERAVQVSLEHDADRVAPGARAGRSSDRGAGSRSGHGLPVEVQGGRRAAVVLHVDPDEVAAGLGPPDEIEEVVAAQGAGDLQAQQRELDRHVAIEIAVGESVDQVEIEPRSFGGEFRAVDLLAQQRQGPGKPAAVERGGAVEGVRRLVTGHVGRRRPAHQRRRHQRQGPADHP